MNGAWEIIRQWKGKKNTGSRITEQDKAILNIKKTRDQLKQYQKKIEGNFVGGQLHGVEKRWYENGTLMAELEYDHGKLIAVIGFWNSSGELVVDTDPDNFLERNSFLH